MGSIVGLEIIEQVAKDLLDPDGKRWTLDDLAGYLNSAQREIVILKPAANVSVRSIKLVPGVTRQTLPPDALALIDITMNMGDDGAKPGSPVTVVEREELDSLAPRWHAETATASEIDHYTYDARSPKTFYVYRKLFAPRWVEAHMSTAPEKVLVKGVGQSDVNTVITLDDIYETPIFDFMLMRAHAKDTDARNDAESDRAYRRFLQRLGLKVQVDKTMDPNRNAPPVDAKRGSDDVRGAR